MVADFVGRNLLRSVLSLMPRAARREYASEIFALSLRRRARVQGTAGAYRLWAREVAAAVAATWAAWTDTPSPPGRRPPGSVRSLFDGIVNDLRFAGREIRRGGATPLLVVLTLAIGIGAVLTVFSMIDGRCSTRLTCPNRSASSVSSRRSTPTRLTPAPRIRC